MQSAVDGEHLPGDVSGGRIDEESYWLEGQPEPANELQWPAVLSFYIDENLCPTLGIPLLAGRALSERDTDDTPPVIFIFDQHIHHALVVGVGHLGGLAAQQRAPRAPASTARMDPGGTGRKTKRSAAKTLHDFSGWRNVPNGKWTS
jgi:hypothetical protein